MIVEPTPLADLPIEMTAEWQLVDLTAGKRDHKVTVTPPPGDKTATVAFAKDGLERLRIGLMQAGLDARYFAWPPEHDPDRAPYRGLQPLEAEDAGIFFGRDGPTVVGLDLLRGLARGGPTPTARHPRRIGRRQVVVPARRAPSETRPREPALSARCR